MQLDYNPLVVANGEPKTDTYVGTEDGKQLQQEQEENDYTAEQQQQESDNNTTTIN